MQVYELARLDSIDIEGFATASRPPNTLLVETMTHIAGAVTIF